MRRAYAAALSMLLASPNPHRQLAWWMQWTQHKQQDTAAAMQQQEQPVTLALSLELLSQVGHEALLPVLVSFQSQQILGQWRIACSQSTVHITRHICHTYDTYTICAAAALMCHRLLHLP
jgi:hypothetical protein